MISHQVKEQLASECDVSIPIGNLILQGSLALPSGATGIVLFAHGSGSSRHSPRNRYVAATLQARGIGTLLFDLLTHEEEILDQRTAHLRFDIPLLGKRLVEATKWTIENPQTEGLRIGYFGASTGAAAALLAAAQLPEKVAAVVSRGGRPDLADEALGLVRAPTLLIVGGDDEVVLSLNQMALARMRCRDSKLEVIPGATHLFEEPGALEEVARIAAGWFEMHLGHVEKSSARRPAGR